MAIQFESPELEKRMQAVLQYCLSVDYKMPTGKNLDLILDMVSHTPHYGKLKGGNKPKPVNRSIHIYLLIEYLKASGMTKAQATETLQNSLNPKLNYRLGVSRLARQHSKIQSDNFGKHVRDQLLVSQEEPSTVIEKIIFDLAPHCDWSLDLPVVHN